MSLARESRLQLAHVEAGERSRHGEVDAPRSAHDGLPPLGPAASVAALQRAAGNGAVSRLLQRVKETRRFAAGTGFGKSTLDIIGWGVVTPMTSSGKGLGVVLEFEDVETVELSEGVTGGVVALHVFEGWTINNVLFDDNGFGKWHGRVPFTITGDQVTFGGAIEDERETGGSGATFTTSFSSGATTFGGYVSLATLVAISGSVSAGGSAGAGPVTVSAPAGTSTSFSGGLGRSFTVQLRPKPPQPVNAPDLAFKIGKAKLEEGQEGVLAGWFQGLPEDTKAAVRTAQRVVSISGYASTTGRRKNNRDLAERRARVVERILRGLAGSNANLNIFFFGEDAATTPDNTEDPTWRRATVRIEPRAASTPGAPSGAPAGTRP